MLLKDVGISPLILFSARAECESDVDILRVVLYHGDCQVPRQGMIVVGIIRNYSLVPYEQRLRHQIPLLLAFFLIFISTLVDIIFLRKASGILFLDLDL